MRNSNFSAPKIFAASGAAIGWLAVATQLYLLLQNRTAPLPDTLIQFFSYFTILTNILVAVSFLAFAISAGTGRQAFFSRPSVSTAIAVYITVVGAVYQLLLRPLWNPQGLQKIVDELLHSVIPVAYLIYWAVWVPKAHLKLSSIFPALIYPLCYLTLIMIRGSFSGFYPYPFVNVTELGAGAVAVNCTVLAVVFMLLNALYIFIGKTWLKNTQYEN